MKIYEIAIKPNSGFGTPLKGDTLFGHFCWQIAYDKTLAQKSLDELFAVYSTAPFAIFSSAYPKICSDDSDKYAFKRPDLPLDLMFELPEDKCELIKKRKEYKNKRWMLVEKGKKTSSLKEFNFVNDEGLLSLVQESLTKKGKQTIQHKTAKEYIASYIQTHNKINRLTGTTGEDKFAPFSVEQEIFYPEIELVIFVGIDESMITIDQVKTDLGQIGKMGFGKDASTGLGKFEICAINEIDLFKLGPENHNACYTLSPCVPEKNMYSEIYFTPFTRFGKHGDILAKSKNPFKNPIIMADEGAILILNGPKVFDKPYVGIAITNVSKTESKAVSQGYSLYIPFGFKEI